MQKTDNLRIRAIHPLILPALFIEELPITAAVASTVNLTRLAARDIIHGQDYRLLVVLGPFAPFTTLKPPSNTLIGSNAVLIDTLRNCVHHHARLF